MANNPMSTTERETAGYDHWRKILRTSLAEEKALLDKALHLRSRSVSDHIRALKHLADMGRQIVDLQVALEVVDNPRSAAPPSVVVSLRGKRRGS